MIQPKSVVVVQFENFEDAKRWYAAEYAAAIPLRNQCLILVDGYHPRCPVRRRWLTINDREGGRYLGTPSGLTRLVRWARCVTLARGSWLAE